MNLPLPDSVQRVFAERLVRGKSTIYYYKNKKIKTFFLDTDSTEIKELPKKRSPEGEDIFRDDLIFYTSDCPQLKSAISLVAYDREAYKKLFHRYQTCKIRPFPFFKYGIIVGYSAYKPIPAISISTTDFRELEYSYDGGFTGGVFMDYPIMLSDISLYAELAYTQHTFSANAMIRWDDTDFYGKISTLQFPVMVRYAYPFNKIRPYAGFGGIFTYNFNIENKLYKATIFNNTIEINDIQVTNVIKEFMVGFTLGGGLSVQILPRNWIFVEARYNRHYTLNTSEALDFSEYQVVTGFTF
jgi:hypothetical protein